MDLHSCDVEHWGPFLETVTVKDLNGKEYECNNKIQLVLLTDEIRSLHAKKNFNELVHYLTNYLSNFGICFQDRDIFFKLSTISGKDIIPDNITEDFENIDQYTDFIQKLNEEMIIEYWKTANQLCAKNLSLEVLNNSLINY